MFNKFVTHSFQGRSDAQVFLEAAIKLGKEDILRDLNYKADLLAVEAK